MELSGAQDQFWQMASLMPPLAHVSNRLPEYMQMLEVIVARAEWSVYDVWC